MDQQALYVQMALTNWDHQTQRAEKILWGFSDAEFQLTVAPGRNRVIYICGHLITVHDRLFELLGLGKRLHPEFDALFRTNPDGAVEDLPGPEHLKACWKEVHEQLHTDFLRLPAAAWFDRHMDVSPEDFAKEPHRNRLMVLMSRTAHAAWHAGQLVLARR